MSSDEILLADKLALRAIRSGLLDKLEIEQVVDNEVLLWLRESCLHEVSNWGAMHRYITARIIRFQAHEKE